jgi:hypothetical protein
VCSFTLVFTLGMGFGLIMAILEAGNIGGGDALEIDRDKLDEDELD